MPQQTTIVEEGYDRVQNAFRSMSGEFEKLQHDVEKRRKRFDKETQKRIKRLQNELNKNPLVKRANKLQRETTKQIEKVRTEATKRIETTLDDMLGALQIASRADVKKLDRKVSKLNKKLREMEKMRTTSASKKARQVQKTHDTSEAASA